MVSLDLGSDVSNDLSTIFNTWKLPDISSLHNVIRTGINLIEAMQTFISPRISQPEPSASNEAKLRKAKGRRRSSGVPVQTKMVELSGIEPLTPCLQSRCSPS